SELETRFMRTQSQSDGSALPPAYFTAKRQLSQTHSEPEGSEAGPQGGGGGGGGGVGAGAGAAAGSGSGLMLSGRAGSSSSAVLEDAVGPGAGAHCLSWEKQARVMVLPAARAALRTMHTEYTRYAGRRALACSGHEGVSWRKFYGVWWSGGQSTAKIQNSIWSRTSITDELETVCGLLSPSRPEQLSLGDTVHRTRHASEMSNPEMAMYLEKETLRDAEESDYQLMSDLIQHRYRGDDADEDEHARQLDRDRERFGNNAFFLTVTDETVLETSAPGSAAGKASRAPGDAPVRPLLRSTAIEGGAAAAAAGGAATPDTITPVSSPVASSPTAPTTTAIVHKPGVTRGETQSSTSTSSVGSIPYGNTETLC
ncbi:Transient receptor potential cation channel trpm, partial [Frankliniella fusca]